MYRWAENGITPVPKSSPKSEQRERERAASGVVVESVAKRTRRKFSAAEKLRVIKRADACRASGKRGAVEAMLREEGIYSSHLYAWRAQLGASGAAGLEQRKPGRKPALDANAKRCAELEKRNAQLARKLHVATVLIELQKKVHAVLGIALPTSDEEP